MIFAKTPAGQQALKERQGSTLTPRQRSAFILFDGRRSADEVLAATAAMGITMDDVQAMLAQGLLEPVAGGVTPKVPGSTAGTATSAATDPALQVARSAMQRYQAGYPIAIELTAGLGLRGFRLNLAVEGTTGYQQLAELAPRIQDAVGDAKYARLASALFD